MALASDVSISVRCILCYRSNFQVMFLSHIGKNYCILHTRSRQAVASPGTYYVFDLSCFFGVKARRHLNNLQRPIDTFILMNIFTPVLPVWMHLPRRPLEISRCFSTVHCTFRYINVSSYNLIMAIGLFPPGMLFPLFLFIYLILMQKWTNGWQILKNGGSTKYNIKERR